MKNEINAVLENMTTTIPEPEDYTGEDGLLYCGQCRKPKEAYFVPDKAAIFGRDRHPAECGCQRVAREEREAAEKRRRHLDTVEAVSYTHLDTIIGNMDCQVFLGGSEPTTLKELSEALGKDVYKRQILGNRVSVTYSKEV